MLLPPPFSNLELDRLVLSRESRTTLLSSHQKQNSEKLILFLRRNRTDERNCEVLPEESSEKIGMVCKLSVHFIVYKKPESEGVKQIRQSV